MAHKNSHSSLSVPIPIFICIRPLASHLNGSALSASFERGKFRRHCFGVCAKFSWSLNHSLTLRLWVDYLNRHIRWPPYLNSHQMARLASKAAPLTSPPLERYLESDLPHGEDDPRWWFASTHWSVARFASHCVWTSWIQCGKWRCHRQWHCLCQCSPLGQNRQTWAWSIWESSLICNMVLCYVDTNGHLTQWCQT